MMTRMDPGPIPPSPELLRQFLADRDIECPGCGYNLRGLTGDRCPECASALALAINLHEPRSAAFISGLVGIGAGLGFNGLIFGWFLWELLVDSRFGPGLHESYTLIVGLVVEGAMLWYWLGSRRRLRLMGPIKRWWYGSLCWLATLLFALAFFANIR
jgi:hypothetical protein